MFANMYAAYDALSPGMQQLLDGLRAVNSSALADVSKTREDRIRDSGADAATEYVAEHPVVRTHPETGRKALYVNVAHTARFVGHDRGREPAAAAVPVRALGAAGVHVPVPAGGPVRSRCGTTGARCTTRSTTTTATPARMHRITLAGDMPT